MISLISIYDNISRMLMEVKGKMLSFYIASTRSITPASSSTCIKKWTLMLEFGV